MKSVLALRWVCFPVLLALTVTVGLAASTGSVYFGQCDDGCSISKVGLDGSDYDPYSLGGSKEFDTDWLARKLYYRHFRWDPDQEQYIPSLRRSDLDGSNEETITDSINPTAITVDPIGEKIYWYAFDGGAQMIYRANLDGTDMENLISIGHQVLDMAVDSGRGKLYWCQFVAEAGALVRRSNLDGSGIEAVITNSNPGVTLVTGIAVDGLRGKLYWASERGISRSRLDGSETVTLIDQNPVPGDPFGGAQDVEVAGNGLVFNWSSAIYLSDLSGSQILPVFTPENSGTHMLATDVPPSATVIPAVSPAGAVVAAVVLLLVSTMILLRRRRT